MAKIQIRRGLQAGITDLVLAEGEFAVALDTGNVYVGTTSGKIHVNPKGGVADTAVKLANSRNFSITGDGTASSVEFDGTANVGLALSLANSGAVAGTYTKVTVDAKGRVTAGAAVTLTDLPNIPTSKITGLGFAATANTGILAGNVVILGSDGKISEALLPKIAISETYTAATQAAMLALTAETGDICIRTDESKSYILSAVPATTLGNWKWLQTPTDSVLSVNGKIGAVVLTASELGATDNKVTNTLSPTEKAYVTGTTEAATSTGGQVFDTGVYLGTTAGELVATKFTGALAGNAATATSATTSATCSGNAATATRLGTARTIAISGAVTGTATNFDGSTNISIPVTAVNPANLSATVPVTKGGTGATTAAAALANLGVTASAAELNYCVGATSNIQNQLNALATADIDGGTF